MRHNLSPGKQAALFTLIAFALTLPGVLLARQIGEVAGAFYMLGPAIAVLVMLFAVTDEARRGGVVRRLGLRPAGIEFWPIALFGTVAVGIAGAVAATALPSAEYVVPDNWPLEFADFFILMAIGSVTFTLGEEIGWRGYLLPRLLHLGAGRAMVIVGLIHATWHMPLILGSDALPIEGSAWIYVPLFYGTVIAASFFMGLLRLYSGSVWPAVIAHGAHNAIWNATGAFLLTTSPAADEYVGGDAGIVIMLGTALGAIALAIWHHRRELFQRPSSRTLQPA